MNHNQILIKTKTMTKELQLTDKELKLLLFKLVQSTSDKSLEDPKLLVSQLYDKLHDVLKQDK